MSALGGVLALLPARGGWRNGRRARFRSVCPKGREGSNPSSPTRRLAVLGGLWPPSRLSAVLVRGDDPPDPPRGALADSGISPLASLGCGCGCSPLGSGAGC